MSYLNAHRNQGGERTLLDRRHIAFFCRLPFLRYCWLFERVITARFRALVTKISVSGIGSHGIFCLRKGEL